MIPPKEWTRFNNDEELSAFLKRTGLLSAKAKEIKGYCYTGAYTDGPVICKIVGCSTPATAVIEIGAELHCVNAEYLHEMQSGMFKWIIEQLKQQSL